MLKSSVPRSRPRSSPTTLSPSFAHSTAMIPPVHPTPTVTTSTLSNVVTISVPPLHLMLHTKRLRFNFYKVLTLDFIDVGSLMARKVLHPPPFHIVVASIN